MEKNELAYYMALSHLEKMTTNRKMEILVSCYLNNKKLSDFFTTEDKYKNSFFELTVNKSNKHLLSADEIKLLNTLTPQIPNYSFLAEKLFEQGYDIITVMDDTYPKQLKKIMGYNSPLVIYAKGNSSLLNNDAVAIVGSRKSKDISLAFTDTIARKKASEGKVVVSGYAKGVDRQALDSALACGGKSIVVLPQGITTFGSGYKHLYKDIISGRVLIISYFHPDAGWSVGLAMARNTVIYSMAKEIYVAESDNKGGTWSGVVNGLKYNQNEKNHDKEKLSIYVRIPMKNENNANIELISMGAQPIDLNGEVKNREDVVDNLENIERDVIKLLNGNVLRPEAIIEKCNLNWSKDKMVSFLGTLKEKGVEKVKVSRYNCYTIKKKEASLFG